MIPRFTAVFNIPQTPWIISTTRWIKSMLWLAINKLSLNINKTKYMIFHAINKSIEVIIPNSVINGIQIDRVNSFNFLGLNLHENMSWKTHTESVANKLAKYSGILNRIKHFLAMDVLRKLYFSMVQSQLQYGILAWGFDHSRRNKREKRIIRIITQSTYKSHCDPYFKALEILKIKDLFELNCIKFLYNFNKGLFPKYFMYFRCSPRSPIHDHDTRYASHIDTISTRTVMASNRIRCRLPEIINSTTESISNKIETHRIHGFLQLAKRFFIDQYPTHCFEINCYVCRNWIGLLPSIVSPYTTFHYMSYIFQRDTIIPVTGLNRLLYHSSFSLPLSSHLVSPRFVGK